MPICPTRTHLIGGSSGLFWQGLDQSLASFMMDATTKVPSSMGIVMLLFLIGWPVGFPAWETPVSLHRRAPISPRDFLVGAVATSNVVPDSLHAGPQAPSASTVVVLGPICHLPFDDENAKWAVEQGVSRGEPAWPFAPRR